MCVSVDLWAGQHLFEALAPGFCLQEEGGRDKERHREERQYLGSTPLQEGPGIHSWHSQNSSHCMSLYSLVLHGQTRLI